MIPDWHANTVYFSALLKRCWPALCAGLKEALDRHGVEVRSLQRTNDVWARDYMPIQVNDTIFVKFDYRPDYLCGHEHLITGEEVCRHVPFLRNVPRSSIRLDGGNVVASSRRIILTEKVFRENPSWSRQKLQKQIALVLQVEECIFIPTEVGDCIGHSDGVVRFLDEDRVVINDYAHLDRGYRAALLRVLKRHRLHVEVLPYFAEGTPMKSEIGSAVGNYVNFLRVGDLVVMPMYRAPQDDEAMRRMERLLPGADVVPLQCVDLAREGGVLNCIGWAIHSQAGTKQPKTQKSGSAD